MNCLTCPDGGYYHSPAIWLYPEAETDVEVTLQFHGGGFMYMSTPPYNDRWRIHVDPSMPFNKYSPTYEDSSAYAFLDYDGFRAGSFQRNQGWCIAQRDLLSWQREVLPGFGFTEAEIDDANYGYGRLILDRQYPQRFLAVYPQQQEIVDTSVSLQVQPEPDTMYRLWLYFVPVDEPISLLEPSIPSIQRTGFTVVELAFLTDLEIPKSLPEKHKLRTLSRGPGSLLAKHSFTD